MTFTVRPLDEGDVPGADWIFREAFGRYLALPEPQSFRGDAAVVATRWRSNPAGALGAYEAGVLIGSSLVTRWGSFGFLGPVSVRPDFWDRGVAKQLVEQSLALLDQWGVRQAGLFTFAESPKHIALYQKFGFWPQHLTAVMSMAPVVRGSAGAWSRYSMLSSKEQEESVTKCALVTETNFPGLDVTRDLRAIADQRLGDIVLIDDDRGLGGFACCHIGAGSEAGTDTTFVKFAAVRAGQNARELFRRLLVGCTELAASSGCRQIVAGVNTARHQAYREMIDQGFRTFLQGVAMHRPNNPAFNRADCFVMDDLR